MTAAKTALLVLSFLLTGALVAGALFVTLPEERQVTLDVQGVATQISTRASTVADLLAQEHIEVGLADVVVPEPTTPLGSGQYVTVRHATTVTLMVNHTLTRIRPTRRPRVNFFSRFRTVPRLRELLPASRWGKLPHR